MNAVLGCFLIVVVSSIAICVVTYLTCKACLKVCETLDYYIEKLSKEKPIADQLTLIKGYMVTGEKALNDLKEAVLEDSKPTKTASKN